VELDFWPSGCAGVEPKFFCPDCINTQKDVKMEEFFIRRAQWEREMLKAMGELEDVEKYEE